MSGPGVDLAASPFSSACLELAKAAAARFASRPGHGEHRQVREHADGDPRRPEDRARSPMIDVRTGLGCCMGSASGPISGSTAEGQRASAAARPGMGPRSVTAGRTDPGRSPRWRDGRRRRERRKPAAGGDDQRTHDLAHVDAAAGKAAQRDGEGAPFAGRRGAQRAGHRHGKGRMSLPQPMPTTTASVGAASTR